MTRAISADSPLLLGSGSPRRREILSGLGIPLVVAPAGVEELELEGEAPLVYLERVVAEKLAAALDRARAPGSALLVADTIVVVGGELLNKPADVPDAVRLLRLLAGRTHEVFTRYALAKLDERRETVVSRTVMSKVSLRAASEGELAAYAATREGLDKAGAYAVQGIGAFLIERIEGSYTNVVGLPACEVVRDLVESGLLEHFP